MATTSTNVAQTYTQIAYTSLGTAGLSISLSSIPSTYTDLRLVLWAKHTTGTAQTGGLTLNSDNGNNYSYLYIEGYPASNVSTNNGGGQASIPLGVQSSLSSAYPYLYIIDIFSYTSAFYKPVMIFCAEDNNSGSSSASEAVNGVWASTSAINTITITSGSNFAVGTSLALYGIQAA
jgi:hypothetical protein